MGRGIIQHPETKKYAIWSSVVDDFITDWLTEDELKQWQIDEFAERIKEEPIKVSRFLTFDECLHTLETYHGKDRVDEVKDGIQLKSYFYEGIRKYPVITLCGSTRFKDEFEKVQKKLTLQGNIVLSVGFFSHWEDKDAYILPKTREMLNDIHKRKIDMADSIFVINVGGYIGESTKSEIEYALSQGKEVMYLEEDK